MKTAAELLRQSGLKAKHSWGQNFLSDEGILERIAAEAEVGKGDTVLELGAGLGHLTRALLATGANVVAVERDREVAAVLKSEMPELKLVEANAAELDFAKTAGVDDLVLVGNLPYHLSSPILFEVLEQWRHVKRVVFTLQAEVVDRLAAEPGNRDYGLLTVLLGVNYRSRECFKLGRHLFHPPPKVDSAVLRLDRLEKPRATVTDDARFKRIVKASFAHRRKTLSNSIGGDRELDAQFDLDGSLAAAGIDGKRRAETLSVEEFASLERSLIAR